MTKNPLINSIVALVYIALVASVMFYGPKFAGKAESIFVPIAMISLFTLSAAVMGYIFFYEPIRLYLDGEKRLATAIFLKTLAMFGLITIFMLLLLFTGSLF